MVMEVFLSETRMEMKATAKLSPLIMLGSYSNTWVALGSVKFKILRTFFWSFLLRLRYTTIMLCSQRSLPSIHDF